MWVEERKLSLLNIALEIWEREIKSWKKETRGWRWCLVANGWLSLTSHSVCTPSPFCFHVQPHTIHTVHIVATFLPFLHGEIRVRETSCECISVIIIIRGHGNSFVIILRQLDQFSTGKAITLYYTAHTHAHAPSGMGNDGVRQWPHSKIIDIVFFSSLSGSRFPSQNSSWLPRSPKISIFFKEWNYLLLTISSLHSYCYKVDVGKSTHTHEHPRMTTRVK